MLRFNPVLKCILPVVLTTGFAMDVVADDAGKAASAAATYGKAQTSQWVMPSRRGGLGPFPSGYGARPWPVLSYRGLPPPARFGSPMQGPMRQLPPPRFRPYAAGQPAGYRAPMPPMAMRNGPAQPPKPAMSRFRAPAPWQQARSGNRAPMPYPPRQMAQVRPPMPGPMWGPPPQAFARSAYGPSAPWQQARGAYPGWRPYPTGLMAQHRPPMWARAPRTSIASNTSDLGSRQAARRNSADIAAFTVTEPARRPEPRASADTAVDTAHSNDATRSAVADAKPATDSAKFN
jgi:hypothetical protein